MTAVATGRATTSSGGCSGSSTYWYRRGKTMSWNSVVVMNPDRNDGSPGMVSSGTLAATMRQSTLGCAAKATEMPPKQGHVFVCGPKVSRSVPLSVRLGTLAATSTSIVPATSSMSGSPAHATCRSSTVELPVSHRVSTPSTRSGTGPRLARSTYSLLRNPGMARSSSGLRLSVSDPAVAAAMCGHSCSIMALNHTLRSTRGKVTHAGSSAPSTACATSGRLSACASSICSRVRCSSSASLWRHSANPTAARSKNHGTPTQHAK
mmetsp:Transcript_36842/g.113719  ORF Transcript_36842/g.113719 Transcript_36842/m.113719 type:complete len:264 (-) Transcript_36842:145-936(-)